MLPTPWRLWIPAAAALLASPLPAQSAHPPLHVDPSVRDCSVRFAPGLTQHAFGRFAREFGSVSAFKQAGSPATLGRGRVLFAIQSLSFRIDDRADAWNDTFVHPDAEHTLGARQDLPLLTLRAGVTDDLDVGAFYTANPNANYGWLGVDGKYRLLRAGEGSPVSVAVRGAYTKTLYVGDMDMHALTADVSVGSRPWRGVRPYVGVGADGVLARETSDAVALRRERLVAPHVFGGLDVTLWRRLSLGAEATLGARPSVQLRVGGVAF